MWRLVSLAISFFAGRLHSIAGPSIADMLEQVWMNARSLFSAAITCVLGSLILTAGVLVSVFEIAQQYDYTGNVVFTATLASFCVVSCVGLIVVAFAVRALQNPVHQNIFKEFRNYQAPQPSMVESLIQTVAQEINKLADASAARQAASHQATQYAQPHSYHPQTTPEQTAAGAHNKSYPQNDPQNPPPLPYH